ncbi:MAG: hypothetical protein AB8F78_00805 [Saprospiraceae bacterium]
MRYAFFSVLLFSVLHTSAQFNPDAGLITSYTEGATFISSSNQAVLDRAFDRDVDTHWQSSAALPHGYIGNENQNILFEYLGDRVTDGLLNTGEIVKPADTLLFDLTGTSAGRISIKAGIRGELSLKLISSTGADTVLATLTRADNYKVRHITIPATLDGILELSVTKTAQVFECAAMTANIEEYVGYLSTTAQRVGQVWIRSWPGSPGAIEARLEGTIDGTNWSLLEMLHPGAFREYPVVLDTPQMLLGVRVVQVLAPANWAKVNVWELRAYDEYGPFGKTPVQVDVPVSFEEMLGVNGLWGWGYGRYSDGVADSLGPARFSSVFAKARNYHNLDWDISSPGEIADYTQMAAGNGTQAKGWVNWDREYTHWRNAGLEVNPSVRITTHPESRWTDPENQARIWSADFAQHFSDSIGTVEIGNEPWSFSAAAYSSILDGAVAGFMEAQVPPSDHILPCALQACDPYVESTSNGKNYIGNRISPTSLSNLKGLNSHAYSFLNDRIGNRNATYPEHPASKWNELNNMLRWRDANAPQLPIYLTEFGYDAAGSGDTCTHSECVSASEAAAYTLRSILLANRLGIKRADYYFFGNSERSGLFSKSGLVSKVSTGAQDKQVFVSLQAFANQLADYRVIEILIESADRYVYKLESSQGDIRWAAWIPQDLNTTPLEISELSGKQMIFTFQPNQPLTNMISGWPSIWQ